MEASDYLRELLAAGMTQTVVADRTGIPQPTISRIARGRVKDVPSKRSRKLHALWELEVAGQTTRTSQRLEVPHLRAETAAKAV